MFRMLTSFRALALLAVLALSISGSALAGSASLIVNRDSRVCLAPIYATQSVDAQGTASYPGVRFTVHRSPNNGIYTDLYQTSDTSLGFRAIFNTSANPNAFPGYFKLCARNLSMTQSSTVNISIFGY
jgi:hypothetical protein